MSFSGHAATKAIALTFDDGPDDQFTPQVLDILKYYEVTATFFCIGAQIRSYPHVLLDIMRLGHTVANHTWSHPYLTKTELSGVVKEIEATSDLIQQVTGRRPRYFRPPYGDLDERVATQVECLNYELILWDIDSADWSGISGPQVASNVLPALGRGSIILHHSAGDVGGTVAALPYLIEVSRAMGYRYASLEELMGVPAYVTNR